MMPAGHGAPACPRAARSALDRRSSAPAACQQPQSLALGPSEPSGSPGSPGSPGPRRGAVRASVPQKLGEALSSQYGLNMFVAGLLLLLAWAVHASGVGKSDLLCFLTALMLLQLLWVLWFVGRSAAHRRLIRPKDTHAGARWLRGESGAGRPAGGSPAAPALPLGLAPSGSSASVLCPSSLALPSCPVVFPVGPNDCSGPSASRPAPASHLRSELRAHRPGHMVPWPQVLQRLRGPHDGRPTPRPGIHGRPSGIWLQDGLFRCIPSFWPLRKGFQFPSQQFMLLTVCVPFPPPQGLSRGCFPGRAQPLPHAHRLLY